MKLPKVWAAASLVALATIPAAGQAPLRTPWGDPDLQGLWTNSTITSFERPAELAGKAVLTEQEAAEFEKQTNRARDADNREGGREADLGRAYNQFWYDAGAKVFFTRRTSLVWIRPRTTSAAQHGGAEKADRVLRQKRSPADGPENGISLERCTLGRPKDRRLQAAQTNTNSADGRLFVILTE